MFQYIYKWAAISWTGQAYKKYIYNGAGGLVMVWQPKGFNPNLSTLCQTHLHYKALCLWTENNWIAVGVQRLLTSYTPENLLVKQSQFKSLLTHE